MSCRNLFLLCLVITLNSCIVYKHELDFKRYTEEIKLPEEISSVVSISIKNPIDTNFPGQIYSGILVHNSSPEYLVIKKFKRDSLTIKSRKIHSIAFGSFLASQLDSNHLGKNIHIVEHKENKKNRTRGKLVGFDSEKITIQNRKGPHDIYYVNIYKAEYEISVFRTILSNAIGGGFIVVGGALLFQIKDMNREILYIFVGA